MPQTLTYSRVTLLRWLVFNIWFISFFAIIASFFLSFIYSSAATLEGDYIKSATMLFGLITPTFGTMLAFYAAKHEEDRDFVASKEFFNIAIMCSVLYHIILIALSIAGVIFLKLDRSLEPGILYRNCVFIVNWMGLLSVLLGPSVWIFAKANTSAQIDSHPVNVASRVETAIKEPSTK